MDLTNWKHSEDVLAAFPDCRALLDAAGKPIGTVTAVGVGRLEFLAAIILAGKTPDEKFSDQGVDAAIDAACRLMEKCKLRQESWDNGFPP